jgi:hypothetical protein
LINEEQFSLILDSKRIPMQCHESRVKHRQNRQFADLFGVAWNMASPLLFLGNIKANRGAVDESFNRYDVQKNSCPHNSATSFHL